YRRHRGAKEGADAGVDPQTRRRRCKVTGPQIILESPAGFAAWLKAAAAGGSVAYYTGPKALALARQLDPELDELANAVGRAAERGQVDLTQRRAGHSWEYRAIKRAAPPKALPNLTPRLKADNHKPGRAARAA